MAHKELAFLTSTPIAHRGLHNRERPENSLAAFGAAVRKGYIIELDVHLLADGAVAVFHDDNLLRMCGENVAIKDLTVRKLRRYQLGKSRERIPLLKDVLALVNGAVPLVIELKHDAPVGELESAVAELLQDYEGDVALKSFHPLIVRNLRRKFPTRPVGQLYSDSMFEKVTGIKRWAFEHYTRWSLWRSDFLSVDHKNLREPLIVGLRDLGKPVLVWNIRSYDARQAVEKLADNYIGEKIL